MIELIQQLTQTVGVQEDQAKGGAGLLFQMAQQKLGAEKFAQVSDCVPGMSDLLSAAPAAGGGGGGLAGALGGLAGGLGGQAGGNLGNLASLAGGFTQLGLNPTSIGQFVPVILSFVQSKGGEGVKEILASALK
ncbi:MAG: DUF2780 domain-containing protein [Cyanobacteria bacterium J06639_1]